MVPGRPEQQYDLRTLDARIRELEEQVRYLTSQLARHKQTIARLLERQTKMETLLAELM